MILKIIEDMTREQFGFAQCLCNRLQEGLENGKIFVPTEREKSEEIQTLLPGWTLLIENLGYLVRHPQPPNGEKEKPKTLQEFHRQVSAYLEIAGSFFGINEAQRHQPHHNLRQVTR